MNGNIRDTGPTECDFFLLVGTIWDSQHLSTYKVLVLYYALKFGWGLFEEAQILFLARSELLGYLRTFQVCLCCLWFIG